MNVADRLLSILFSNRTTAALLILFSLAMGIGTFIESAHDTPTAKVMVYNAWWFELMIILLAANFVGNIKKYRLLRVEKWPILLLHISWILIIVGAGITRYLGNEGIMPIREGEFSDTYLSEKTYLSVSVIGERNGQSVLKPLESSYIFSEKTNNFKKSHWRHDFNGIPINIEYVDYIKGAEEGLVEDANGDNYLKIVEQRDQFF